MTNEKTIINNFLNGSPYTDEEKKEITLYIDGLSAVEKDELILLMNESNETGECL